MLTPSLWWLGIIAVATWAAALAGWQVRHRHRPGWLPWHISLMCGSYISLTTALLVVNLGTGVPIAWILPAAIGSPLIAYKAYRVAAQSMVRPDRPPELADSPYEPVNGHLADAQPAGDL